MDNRIPATPFPDPVENHWPAGRDPVESLAAQYQWQQQAFRARVESGESPEAVRESCLMGFDLLMAVYEAAVEDAFAGVSEPTKAAEEAYAAFPALPRSLDN